jgi:hypothetical protein
VARKKADAEPAASSSRSAEQENVLRCAADGEAFQKLDKTWFLGPFDGVPGPVLRLVNEDGDLVLVATSAAALDRRLVRDIEAACRWIDSHRPVVDARWRAVLGPNVPPPPTLVIRVVATAGNTRLETKLAKLSATIFLRTFSVQATDVFRHPERSISPDREYLSHPALAPLLLEARYSAYQSLQPAPSRDHWDSRTHREYLLIRTYGLLVAATASLTVLGSRLPGEKRSRRTEPVNQALLLRDTLLRVLGVFAKRLSRSALTAVDQPTRRAVTTFLKTTDRLYGGGAALESGAYVSRGWYQPVPEEFISLIRAGTAGESLQPADDILHGLSEKSERLLGEANIGIASATYIGHSFDRVRLFSAEPHPDRDFVRAAHARVLAAHRILLDLLGVDDRAAIVAMLSLAVGISPPESDPKEFSAWVAGDPEHAEFLAASRLQSLGALERPGRLSIRHKCRGPVLEMAVAQEPLVLRALAQALAPPSQTPGD